jgi:3-oxoacyl-[acyl-carrier protein] reductase
MTAPVTLITGASRGLGLHLARHYLAAGHTVVGCSRGESALDDPNYSHSAMDVGSESDVTRVFADVRKRFGGVDHVINNAGIASMNHALLTPGRTVEAVLQTNVGGTFLVSREAAKLMQRRKWGRIVNVVSVAVPLQLEGEAIYAASKAAVVSLTSILARELAPFHVTVNAVGPTAIETDLIRGVPRERLDALLARQAIHRFAELSDVANVIDFFLRRESAMVTGQTIYLGGV